MLATGLGTLVTYNPCTASPDAPLHEIVCTFEQMGFHHLPVVDEDQRLLGMISERDVVRTVEMLRSVTFADATAPAAELPNCTAADMMSRRLVVLEEGHAPQSALGLMVEQQIHSLPVLEGERLVGVVTSSDFLREFSYGSVLGGRKSASDVMLKTYDPISLEASLDEAKFALDAAGSNYLVVMGDDFPLGVISRRDVSKARYRRTVRELLGEVVMPGPSSVRELIHGAPTVAPGRRLGDVAAVMVECRVQAVAIVNQATRLLGIVTEDVILQTMLAGLAAK